MDLITKCTAACESNRTANLLYKLLCASSGDGVLGLKYLYNSQREDNVPSRPTDPIESFCAHKSPGGAQLIAIARSAVKPITEIMSRLCKLLLCLCLVDEELKLLSCD